MLACLGKATRSSTLEESWADAVRVLATFFAMRHGLAKGLGYGTGELGGSLVSATTTSSLDREHFMQKIESSGLNARQRPATFGVSACLSALL
jgi:hypothetical protein